MGKQTPPEEEEETTATVEVDKSKPICNCDPTLDTYEEFCIAPCPVHGLGYTKTKSGDMIITDDHLVKEDQIRVWRGHVFTCPSCHKDTIMAGINFCGHCGRSVVIRSHTVTKYIRGAKP